MLGFIDIKSRLNIKLINKKYYSYLFGPHDNEWRFRSNKLNPIRHPKTTNRRLLQNVDIVEGIQRQPMIAQASCIDLNYFIQNLPEGKTRLKIFPFVCNLLYM
jgi:hypothetical protein